MSTVTLYHNPRCSKSREALALLQQKGIKPDIILYLETPPSEEQLRKLLQQLRFKSARELMRKKEELYCALKLDTPDLSEKILLQTLAHHPKLIERPIGVYKDRAIIGRPPEQILTLLVESY